jgi:hypothetical protein
MDAQPQVPTKRVSVSAVSLLDQQTRHPDVTHFVMFLGLSRHMPE